MDFHPNIPFAALLVTITSVSLIFARDWRWNILILAGQYVGVFFLVSASWPFTMAVTKLVAGWIASAVLGMAIVSVPELYPVTEAESKGRWTAERLFTSVLRRFSESAFYFLTALLVLVVLISQIPNVLNWIPFVSKEYAWSGLVLISFGLLKTGFTDQPFLITIGILSSLSGFEILYAAVQSSLLMAGLLSGVTLALSVAGAYLLLSSYMESPN